MIKDETRSNGWTMSTLYTHLDAKIEALNTLFTALISGQKEAVSIAQQAADRAVNKAELSTKERLDSGNNIKEAMQNQQKTFPTKDELMLLINPLLDDVRVLKEAAIKRAAQAQGTGQGKDETMKIIAWVVGVVGGLFGLYGLLVK